MITDDIIKDAGFYHPPNVKDWWHTDLKDVSLVPYADGRILASVGAQKRHLKTAADFKSFTELMWLLAELKTD